MLLAWLLVCGECKTVKQSFRCLMMSGLKYGGSRVRFGNAADFSYLVHVLYQLHQR
jgi:hypothetical protein